MLLREYNDKYLLREYNEPLHDNTVKNLYKMHIILVKHTLSSVYFQHSTDPSLESDIYLLVFARLLFRCYTSWRKEDYVCLFAKFY